MRFSSLLVVFWLSLSSLASAQTIRIEGGAVEAFAESGGISAFDPGGTAFVSDDDLLRQRLIQIVESRAAGMTTVELRQAIVAALQSTPPLSPAAVEVLDAYRQQAAAIQRDADRKIAVHRRRAAADLKEIQVQLTKAGQLDEALAVRSLIWSLSPALREARPDPGNLTGFRQQLGKTLYFRVRGEAGGSVWGTKIYTDDSTLAAAAVHAGALQNGQTGIVKVTVLPGRLAYAGSTQNGIASSDYGQYSGSYRVEPADQDELPADENTDAAGKEEADTAADGPRPPASTPGTSGDPGSRPGEDARPPRVTIPDAARRDADPFGPATAP